MPPSLLVPQQSWVGTGPCCIVKAEGGLCLVLPQDGAKPPIFLRPPARRSRNPALPAFRSILGAAAAWTPGGGKRSTRNRRESCRSGCQAGLLIRQVKDRSPGAPPSPRSERSAAESKNLLLDTLRLGWVWMDAPISGLVKMPRPTRPGRSSPGTWAGPWSSQTPCRTGRSSAPCHLPASEPANEDR